MTKSYSDLIKGSGLLDLLKAGEEKAGHLYQSRKMGPGGHWIYEYADAAQKKAHTTHELKQHNAAVHGALKEASAALTGASGAKVDTAIGKLTHAATKYEAAAAASDDPAERAQHTALARTAGTAARRVSYATDGHSHMNAADDVHAAHDAFEHHATGVKPPERKPWNADRGGSNYSW